MQAKNNIVIVVPKFCIGGAEIMCENLINAIDKDIFNVYVVSLFKLESAITERIEKQNISIIYLNKRQGLDVSIISKLTKVLKEIRPVAVHSHLYLMEYIFPAVLKGLPFLFINTRRISSFCSLLWKE